MHPLQLHALGDAGLVAALAEDVRFLRAVPGGGGGGVGLRLIARGERRGELGLVRFLKLLVGDLRIGHLLVDLRGAGREICLLRRAGPRHRAGGADACNGCSGRVRRHRHDLLRGRLRGVRGGVGRLLDVLLGVLLAALHELADLVFHLAGLARALEVVGLLQVLRGRGVDCLRDRRDERGAVERARLLLAHLLDLRALRLARDLVRRGLGGRLRGRGACRGRLVRLDLHARRSGGSLQLLEVRVALRVAPGGRPGRARGARGFAAHCRLDRGAGGTALGSLAGRSLPRRPLPPWPAAPPWAPPAAPAAPAAPPWAASAPAAHCPRRRPQPRRRLRPPTAPSAAPAAPSTAAPAAPAAPAPAAPAAPSAAARSRACLPCIRRAGRAAALRLTLHRPTCCSRRCAAHGGAFGTPGIHPRKRSQNTRDATRRTACECVCDTGRGSTCPRTEGRRRGGTVRACGRGSLDCPLSGTLRRPGRLGTTRSLLGARISWRPLGLSRQRPRSLPTEHLCDGRVADQPL